MTNTIYFLSHSYFIELDIGMYRQLCIVYPPHNTRNKLGLILYNII